MPTTCASCAPPPDYLAAHGTPQIPEDLQQHQLIAFRDAVPRALVREDRTVGTFDPNIGRCRLRMDDGHSQKLATLAGAGISANSIWSVHGELANGTLIRVLPDCRLDDGAVLWLVYPHSNVLTAKVRVFIDFLLDRIGRAPPWRSEVR